MFGGKELWKECYYGNPKAWKEMKEYNEVDVYALEDLYIKLRAWAPDCFPKIYDYTDEKYECGTCGYHGNLREGTEKKARKYRYRQYMCPKCGTWQSGRRIV